MTVYELMIKTNHHLIKGGELTESQKANISVSFLQRGAMIGQYRVFIRA